MNYKQLSIMASEACISNTAWEWEQNYAKLVLEQLRTKILDKYRRDSYYEFRAKLDAVVADILTT